MIWSMIDGPFLIQVVVLFLGDSTLVTVIVFLRWINVLGLFDVASKSQLRLSDTVAYFLSP